MSSDPYVDPNAVPVGAFGCAFGSVGADLSIPPGVLLVGGASSVSLTPPSLRDDGVRETEDFESGRGVGQIRETEGVEKKWIEVEEIERGEGEIERGREEGVGNEVGGMRAVGGGLVGCLLYTSPSPRDS